MLIIMGRRQLLSSILLHTRQHSFTRKFASLFHQNIYKQLTCFILTVAPQSLIVFVMCFGLKIVLIIIPLALILLASLNALRCHLRQHFLSSSFDKAVSLPLPFSSLYFLKRKISQHSYKIFLNSNVFLNLNQDKKGLIFLVSYTLESYAYYFYFSQYGIFNLHSLFLRCDLQVNGEDQEKIILTKA